MSTDDRARTANIFDVARLAGVSHQTVSRVLNGHTSVRPSTRQRVEEAIKQLRYRPSSAARALVTRRSRNLGLIIPGSADFGPASTVLAFTRAARAAHYTVSISSVFEPDEEAVRVAVEALLGQHVEAVIVVSDDRRIVDAAARLELDVPLLGADAGIAGVPHAGFVDQYAGARIATEHLVGLGHRRIVHLAGPATSVDGAERERGWRDVIAEHGLASSPPLFGDWTPDSGYRLVQQAVASGFTAIVSANDLMALGALHALADARIDVPSQVSVVGFDDIPEAAHFRPALTTINQDFDQFGADLMHALLAVLEGQPIHVVPRSPTLVVRESTAPHRDAPAGGSGPRTSRHAGSRSG